jgi:dihydrofolate reductase
VKAIVATDKFWGIGKDNNLLFHIPEDMKFFKSQTEGKVVLMGSKTFESLPGGKPLPNRINLVLSNSTMLTTNGTSCFIGNYQDLEPIIKRYDPDDVYLIGGGSVYKKFLHDCTEVYVTRYNKSFSSDTFFPNLHRENYVMREVIQSGEYDGAEYKITRWENIPESVYVMTGIYVDRSAGIHEYILSKDGLSFTNEDGNHHSSEFMRDYITNLYNSWEHFVITHDEKRVQDGIWRYRRTAVDDNNGIYCSMEAYGSDIDECSDNSIRLCDFLHNTYLESSTQISY